MQTLIIQCSCGKPDCDEECVMLGTNTRIIEKTDGLGERVIFRADDFDEKKFRASLRKHKKESESNLD